MITWEQLQTSTEEHPVSGNAGGDLVAMTLSEQSTESVVEAADAVLFANYRRAPLAFSHGQGCRLWDLEGRSYLDFVGGVAVSSLGHAHPALVKAISEQAGRYLHVSNLYQLPEQVQAARLLADASGLPRVFFCNSGAEANEAALKLARRYAYDNGRGPKVLTADNSFHGRTMGALAATGNPDYHEGFQPLPRGFGSLPYNDLDAWEPHLRTDVCAVLVEPVQGEGGVIPGDPHFLFQLRQLCRERGILFMLDEVQTGVGRCGVMLAGGHLEPDVVTLAKGLGGGVPVGAVLARDEVAAVLKPGMHGCTFGGNALSCAAVCAVLPEVEALLPSVKRLGERLMAGLRRLEKVEQVRGQGLLIGADLTVDAKEVELACRERGLLVNPVRPRTLRLAPPLVVTAQEVDLALDILKEVL
ncbi:MAG: aspartate aminotransferase family protein [Candidatus Eremiobacterota bacterium]